MPLGKFIILEGGDCCGKTTFRRFLEDKHPEIFFSHEPGGCPYGMEIRKLLLNHPCAEASDNLTKFLLYWASKNENFAKHILPVISQGGIVVSDRFEGSTYAFQIGEDPSLEDLFWLTRAKCLTGIEPVYMHFDVSVEVAIERAQARAAVSDESNFFDRRGVAYRTQVRRSYQGFFANRRIRSVLVDASLPKEKMLAQAYEQFKSIAGV